jgi:sulfopyruvate decarboxylase subunit beta
LDNHSYASTAGLGTYSERIDLGAVAQSCGITIRSTGDQDSLREALLQARTTAGPQVLHIEIEPGNTPNIPLLLMDPVVIAARFRAWLDQEQAGGS